MVEWSIACCRYRFRTGARQSVMDNCQRIVGLGVSLSSPFSPQDAAFLEEASEIPKQTGGPREPRPSNRRHRCGV